MLLLFRKLWKWCGINDLFFFFLNFFYAIDEVGKWVLSDFYTYILCLFQQGMLVQCRIVF